MNLKLLFLICSFLIGVSVELETPKELTEKLIQRGDEIEKNGTIFLQEQRNLGNEHLLHNVEKKMFELELLVDKLKDHNDQKTMTELYEFEQKLILLESQIKSEIESIRNGVEPSEVTSNGTAQTAAPTTPVSTTLFPTTHATLTTVTIAPTTHVFTTQTPITQTSPTPKPTTTHQTVTTVKPIEIHSTDKPIANTTIVNVTREILRGEKLLQTYHGSHRVQIEAELSALKSLLHHYETGGSESLIIQISLHESRLKHLLDRI